jgi:hypothetical protein
MDSVTTTFTPSELVLLKGNEFVDKGRPFDTLTLISNGQAVRQKALVQCVIAAAILASEQHRDIRLEVREKKVLFGLAKPRTLYIEPTGAAFDWPEGTIEASIPVLAKSLKDKKGTNEVRNLVYSWLGQDSSNPFHHAIAKVHAGLGKRNLLEKVEKKVLVILKSTAFAFPESTGALLANQPVGPVKNLLESCEIARPEVWKLLNDQILKAINSRVEQDTSD